MQKGSSTNNNGPDRLYRATSLVSTAIIRAIAYNVVGYRCWRVPVAVPVAEPVSVSGVFVDPATAM